jgi:hypothetical protein
MLETSRQSDCENNFLRMRRAIFKSGCPLWTFSGRIWLPLAMFNFRQAVEMYLCLNVKSTKSKVALIAFPAEPGTTAARPHRALIYAIPIRTFVFFRHISQRSFVLLT